MTFQIKRNLRAVLLSAIVLALPTTLLADTFERPPNFAADKIRGIKAAGPNYTIKSPVRSNGLFRIYELATPHGEFTVQGDHMMRMRINELAALDELERLSQSEQFSRAMVNAGLSPVKYAGKLIVNPVGTIQNTFAGIGSFLGSVGSGVANAGKTQDDTVSSLIGVTKERRQLAAKYGVDPYTDFPPLAAKLKQLAEAGALGGLAVTGAMMAIPGAAGIVVSNVSTANMLGDMRVDELARNYTASQILDLNRKRLLAMGIDSALTEALLANRNYTPVDLAAMVAALDSMNGVGDRIVFVRRAAVVNSRANAYVMRKHAEMAAAHQARTGSFTRFVSLAGFPFNQTRDGGIVGVMPVDIVSWNEATARAMNETSVDMRRLARGGNAELRITGTATNLAKQRLKALGWRLVENSRI
jgi:hypothetical protein